MVCYEAGGAARASAQPRPHDNGQPLAAKRELEYRKCHKYLFIRYVSYIIMNKRELEYRIPRLPSHANSRRFPKIFGDFCKNETCSL